LVPLKLKCTSTGVEVVKSDRESDLCKIVFDTQKDEVKTSMEMLADFIIKKNQKRKV